MPDEFRTRGQRHASMQGGGLGAHNFLTFTMDAWGSGLAGNMYGTEWGLGWS